MERWHHMNPSVEVENMFSYSLKLKLLKVISLLPFSVKCVRRSLSCEICVKILTAYFTSSSILEKCKKTCFFFKAMWPQACKNKRTFLHILHMTHVMSLNNQHVTQCFQSLTSWPRDTNWTLINLFQVCEMYRFSILDHIRHLLHIPTLHRYRGARIVQVISNTFDQLNIVVITIASPPSTKSCSRCCFATCIVLKEVDTHMFSHMKMSFRYIIGIFTGIVITMMIILPALWS